MPPIKITGYDPDAFEKPDPEPSSRPVRRLSPEESPRSRPEAPPREVPKRVDQKTADHLLHKYGLKNVKYTELAPKKSPVKTKASSTHRYTGPKGALDTEKVENKVDGDPGSSAPDED